MSDEGHSFNGLRGSGTLGNLMFFALMSPSNQNQRRNKLLAKTVDRKRDGELFIDGRNV